MSTQHNTPGNVPTTPEEVKASDVQDTLLSLYAPRWHATHEYPSDLYSQILPGLFMGGTDDAGTVDFPVALHSVPDSGPFSAVVTLYSWAQPMGWGVEEVRYGFYDSSVEHFETDKLLRVARWAFDRWQEGESVLIRCQAGLNRSGLVTALVLLQAGYSPAEAIKLIREKRSSLALFNNDFVHWLVTKAEAILQTNAA